MTKTAQHAEGVSQVEALLRRELAQADQALAGVAPVLCHLLASAGHVLVSDDVVARIRGMLGDLAAQLLRAEDKALGRRSAAPDDDRAERLAAALAECGIVLSNCYALAVEGQLAEELELRGGIDQVLSPLMQELIASEDEATAELAMAAMAAQARFVQAQRRMSLPLTELPAETFHELVRIWAAFASDVDMAARAQAEALLRAGHDESGNRCGLLGRLASRLKSGARAALEVEHGGFALFVTALASLSRQPRELVVLSCHPRQVLRLALSLCTTGLEPEAIMRQIMAIQPDFVLPEGFAGVGPDQARELLDNSPLGTRR